MKTFMVRVVEVYAEAVLLRLPSGKVAKMATEGLDGDPAVRAVLPLKVGDEIPSFVGDNGNLNLRFRELRRA